MSLFSFIIPLLPSHQSSDIAGRRWVVKCSAVRCLVSIDRSAGHTVEVGDKVREEVDRTQVQHWTEGKESGNKWGGGGCCTLRKEEVGTMKAWER